MESVAQPANDWTSVEAAVGRIVSESAKPFAPETVSQIGDFLKYIRGRTAVPEVAKGYWSTLRIIWDKLEIEIRDDGLEVYKLQPDGKIDIRYVHHVVGEPFSADLEVELPKTNKKLIWRSDEGGVVHTNQID